MRKAVILALAVLAPVALVIACNGGDSGPGGDVPPQVIEGALPPNFPDDFPLYPNLDIGRSTPLGERYVVEASSEASPEDIVDFYKQELTKGRWELLETDDSSQPNSTTFRFTAPGWAVDGRVIVSRDTGDNGRTVVGIAMPMEAGEGE